MRHTPFEDRIVSKSILFRFGLVVAFWVLAVGPGQAQPNSMPTGSGARGPAAATAFCRQMPRECAPAGPRVHAVALDSARLQLLRAVNAAVNNAVADETDRNLYGQEDVWSLPVGGKGDCEDLALLKRKRLIEQGWPSSALLMTIVTTPSGEGHAVLTVVTDQGDYVLDSRTSAVSLWTETGYEFYTRQAQSNPQRWVWIEPGLGSTVASLARSPRQTATW
jgi:predicted transglutaminase-like cysteine proteinase